MCAPILPLSRRAPVPKLPAADASPAVSKFEYFDQPKGMENRTVEVNYVNLDRKLCIDAKEYAKTIIENTPKIAGRNQFTSVHIIGPNEAVGSQQAEATISTLVAGLTELNKDSHVYRLDVASGTKTAPTDEFNCIFRTASSLILNKADRASLVVFVGWEDIVMDSYAAFIGMLPFRGVQVALISMRDSYGDLMRFTTPSGTFHIDGLKGARMGKFTVHAVFGALPSKKMSAHVATWKPVDISSEETKSNVSKLPFKIGGLFLPMLTHNGTADVALASLARLLAAKYPNGYTPIVSTGETCDALGYGYDLLNALGQKDGFHFTHKSGETFKCYEAYASKRLFDTINRANASGLPPVIIAVGGGVNGNCIGLVASITNSDFIEVPTSPMHYNDAVTSAKKAFSLVVDGRILSKNILGAFYLPQLAFCVNEWILTINSASAHATVGEATKTMNMLGVANSAIGAADFHNVRGGVEFASDFTKIMTEVGGFDELVKFIQDPATLKRKMSIIAVGKKIRNLMNNDTTQEGLGALLAERKRLMSEFRLSFYNLSTARTESILSFLTTINREIVCAKAMFLAYSDPFEKYRALLFEYAHTLGHGVEAFANDLYAKARESNVEIPESAMKLHGQCVGMAVLWAGEMSRRLGKLDGLGFDLHQSAPYLFNRFGGFSFGPLRKLCDTLNVDKFEFCEKVLQVVRRDNKRGYCKCSDPSKSVDQLVTERPGKMLGSRDPNAQIRYLVEVDEMWQKEVLGKAFDGHFDKVCDLVDNELTFVHFSEKRPEFEAESVDVAHHIRSSIVAAYLTENDAMIKGA